MLLAILVTSISGAHFVVDAALLLPGDLGAVSAVRLTLTWTDEELTVSTANPLEEPARQRPVQEHRGLDGIRRRCALYGGQTQIAADRDFIGTTAWPLRSVSSQAV